jgi:hypothetical protein
MGYGASLGVGDGASPDAGCGLGFLGGYREDIPAISSAPKSSSFCPIPEGYMIAFLSSE